MHLHDVNVWRCLYPDVQGGGGVPRGAGAAIQLGGKGLQVEQSARSPPGGDRGHLFSSKKVCGAFHLPPFKINFLNLREDLCMATKQKREPQCPL